MLVCKCQAAALPVLTYQTYAAVQFSPPDIFASALAECPIGLEEENNNGKH